VLDKGGDKITSRVALSVATRSKSAAKKSGDIAAHQQHFLVASCLATYGGEIKLVNIAGVRCDSA